MDRCFQNFRPVANGAKHKGTFDVTDVTYVTFRDINAIFSVLQFQNDQKMQEFKRNMPLKVLGIRGKQNLTACHAFHAM